jgi:hypothetical protein
VVAELAALTSVAAADIILDILAHGGPEEGAGNQVKRFGDTEISGSRGIVTFFQDDSLKFRVVRNTDEAFMQEKSIVDGVWAIRILASTSRSKDRTESRVVRE